MEKCQAEIYNAAVELYDLINDTAHFKENSDLKMKYLVIWSKIFNIYEKWDELNKSIDKSERKTKQRIKNKLEVFKVAYYLCKYRNKNLFPNYNYSQTLKYFAKLFDMKWTTLKAYADTFDWFIPTTNRVGLRKTNIEPIMKEVLDEYEKQDEKNILKDIKEIITVFKNKK